MTHLTLLTIFCLAQIAVGVAIGRRVRNTSDFFVAGRRLGPVMLFSTMVAANIGAGSTVGAAGYGYRDGLAAWWWVGSAAIGSIVLALWVGPRIRRLAEAHDLQTLGDFLEWRYDWRVRAAATALLWIGTLMILAGQLLALSFVLEAVAGWPRWVGCLTGGVVMTIYFAAGGMLSTIWVNLVQLVVLLIGFGLALPYAFGAVGGWEGLRQATDSTGSYWSLWRGGGSGWIFLAMLGPSFFLSPGLLQKVYGARDDRAVRAGVLANAAVLFAFAFLPVLLGMIARALHPGLANRELALPMLLVHDLPLTIGSLGLAALVAAEISTADAILFMLSTSLSRDLYQRFLRPAAADADVLRVARITSVVAGVAGVIIAILVTKAVADALGFFYTLLSVSLFVPIVGGLCWRALGARQALVAMLVGVLAAAAAQFAFPAALPPEVTPAMVGIIASVAAAVAGTARPGARGSATASST
jgi:SSS family solute:Na+ symporter